METSFESVYNQLKPHIDSFETKRKMLKTSGIQNGGIATGFIMLIGFFFLPTIGHLVWFVIIIALVVGAVIANSKSKEITEHYKKEIIPLILNSVLPGAKYEPEQGISEETFRSCKLFTEPDRYSSEDFISGRIDKTDLCFSEVHAEERHVTTTKNGTKEYWTDIFRGFLFIADFHKDFSGQTILYRNSWLKFRFGSEKRVKLENNEFERCFDTFSTDEIEARYILSTSMMERLVAMNYRLGDGVTVCFRNSHVYIAIPDAKNHFEASLWSALTRENLEAEFQTISELIQIVNELNLNLRIWTKE